MISKNKYSLFKNIELLDTKEKKRLNVLLENFKNSICEIYKIDKELIDFEIDNFDKIHNFLIVELGVIEKIEEIENLKKLLKERFNNFISVISRFLKMRDNSVIDESLKKYMDVYRKARVEEYIANRNSPTIMDFFCGAGGMSLGFYQNGFKTILANDIESVCTDTYSFNHLEVPRDRIVTGDISDIVRNIELYDIGAVDVIIGGPPCQGFSIANRQRIIDDPRNILYKHYVEAVRRIKPKFFVMENVKGMKSVADQIIDDFKSLDNCEYDVAFEVFNAKNFSVPQNRERLIFIGLRNDIKLELEISAKSIIKEINDECSKLESYILNDALENIQDINASTIKNSTELDSEDFGKKINLNVFENNKYINLINNDKQNKLIFNHKARFNNDRDIEIFTRLNEGDDSSDEKIADIMPYATRAHMFKDKYYKLDRNKVCKTITAHMKFDCNMYIHPWKARGLTPREAARVQSYPDDYFFQGPYTKTYMQVGNSVPPLMSRIIARILRKYL